MKDSGIGGIHGWVCVGFVEELAGSGLFSLFGWSLYLHRLQDCTHGDCKIFLVDKKMGLKHNYLRFITFNYLMLEKQSS